MSDRGETRFGARRAALRRAIHDGDAVGAARAASRLRVPGRLVTSAEFAHAREVRRTLGLALVRARLGASAPAPVTTKAPPVAERRDLRRYLAAAVAIAALLLFFLWPQEPGGGGGAPAAATPTPRTVLVATVSRGRTLVAPPEVVVVVESPTPEPSVAPTATAAPTAAPTGTPAATVAPTAGPAGRGGTGTGGRGSGGSGNGTGNGNGNGSGSGTPRPSPTATPRVPPPGYTRLNILVLDARTRRPVPDVCVVIGTLSCSADQPHTDAFGRWSADVAASSAKTLWDLLLIKDDYVTKHDTIVLPGGVTRIYTYYLQRPVGQ